MNHTRTLAVQILNDTSLCSEAKKKAENLAQLEELLIRKEPSLLPEFLPEMVQLQVDSSPLVRKTYAQFLGQVAGVGSNAASLQAAAANISALLKDSSPLVAAAALRACSAILKTALALLAIKPNEPDVVSAWEAAAGMQQVATGLLQASTQEGVKLNAAKLVEMVILLYSADRAPLLPGTPPGQPAPPLPRAAALNKDAAAGLAALQEFIKPEVAHQTSGPLVMCAIKALTVVATARSSFMPKVVQSLITLAKQGSFKADNPDISPDARGVEISIGNILRNSLVAMLRSRHENTKYWRDRIVEAMRALGAEQAAESALKYVARQEYKENREKDKARAGDTLEGPDSKKARLDGPNSPSAIHANQPTAMPQQQPLALNGVGVHVSAMPTTAGLPPAMLTALLQQQYQQQFQGRPPLVYSGQSMLHPQRPPQAPVLLPMPAQQTLMTLYPPPGVVAAQRAATATPPLQQAMQLDQAPLPDGVAAALLPSLQDASTTSAPPPPLTSANDMLQLHMMLPALLSHPDTSQVSKFLDVLTTERPALLADLVIALMMSQEVPSVEDIADKLQQEQVEQEAQGAGSTPATPTHEPTAALPAALPEADKLAMLAISDTGSHVLPSLKVLSGVLRRPIGSDARHRHVPPGIALLPNELRPSPATAATTTAPQVPPDMAKALSKGMPLVKPSLTSRTGAVMLRTSAIRRMAACGETLPLHALPLWKDLLTKLAACNPAELLSEEEAEQGLLEEEKVSECMLVGVAVKQIESGNGIDAAVKWLNALFIEESKGVNVEALLETPTPQPLPIATSTVDTKGDPNAAVQTHKVETTGTQQAPIVLEGNQPEAGNTTAENGQEGMAVEAVTTNDQETVDPLHGSRYETALLRLLGLLRDHGRWNDIYQIMADVLALTSTGCIQFLAQLLSDGGEAATTALRVARDIIQHRPQLRENALGFALDACYDVDPSTRNKAVRLCTNHLTVMPLDGVETAGTLVPSIKAAASEALSALLAPPPDEVVGVVAEGQERPTDWTTEEAARYCELYTKLCGRYHDMLPGLMQTFAAAPEPIRAALLTASNDLSRALGHQNSQLVQLVKDPPQGTEALITHMLDTLMSAYMPGEDMLQACRERYWAGDVSMLVPVVAVLNKPEVLQALPSMLKLPGINLRSLYKKLVTPDPRIGDALFSPAELLVALHALHPQRDAIPASMLIAAVGGALHAPDVFPQQAVAQALQQMEMQAELPLLFMRTVITALKSLPKLRRQLFDLLSRLISRQIWLNIPQWRGFLLLVDDTGKPYFPLMLQLPVPVLEQSLGPQPGQEPQGQLPPHIKPETAAQLAKWALSQENKIQLLRPVAELLQHWLPPEAGAAGATGTDVASAVSEQAMPEAASVNEVEAEDEEESEEVQEEAKVDENAGQTQQANVEGQTAVAADGTQATLSEGHVVDEFDLDFEELEQEENEGQEDAMAVDPTADDVVAPTNEPELTAADIP